MTSPAPRWRTRGQRANLAALPVLIIVSCVWVYPLVLIASGAFATNTGYLTQGANPIPHPVTLSAFPRAWSEADFGGYFFNTVFYAAAGTFVELAKSALCGYVLARYKFPGRGLLRTLIVLTLFVPTTSFIIPQFLLVSRLGLDNSYAGVLLVFASATGGLYVLLFEGFFRTVPPEVYDAATVDGAGFVRTFWTVFPLSRPVIATVVIFSVIAIWNDFVTPLFYAFSNTHVQSLAVGLYKFFGGYGFDATGFAAGTLMSIAPVVLIFLFFQRYFVRGLAGAVKG